MSVNHKEWRVVKVLQYQHCYLLKAKIALLPLQFNVFKMFSASKLLWNKLHSEITQIYRPPRCGKVMFSVVSVCPRVRGSMWPLPMMHWTSPPPNPYPVQWPHPPTAADIWWFVKHVRLASGRYASCWNAFLWKLFSCEHFVFQTWSSTTIKDSSVVTIISV